MYLKCFIFFASMYHVCCSAVNDVHPCFIYEKSMQITLMFHRWIMTETWISVPRFINETCMKIILMFHPWITAELWIWIFWFIHETWMQITLMYRPCFPGLKKMLFIQFLFKFLYCFLIYMKRLNLLKKTIDCELSPWSCIKKYLV